MHSLKLISETFFGNHTEMQWNLEIVYSNNVADAYYSFPPRSLKCVNDFWILNPLLLHFMQNLSGLQRDQLIIAQRGA